MSARDELTKHFGYADDDYWHALVDRYRAEVVHEAAAWLHSVGESSAAYLLSTCDVHIFNEVSSKEATS